MALRVLLADESSTIKKVFQLALQDYAVEVRSVNVGLDVVDVAQSFQPDIIFADVLLQKRNGYDVSAELKNNESLKSTPVVLMWSGFVDLDEDKFQASQADAQLEKPFDVQGLRSVIQGLVSKTKTQNIGEFLNFPEMPEIQEEPPAEHPVNSLLNLPNAKTSKQSSPAKDNDWDMDNFASIEEVSAITPSGFNEEEDFKQVTLPAVEPQTASSDFSLEDDDEDEDQSWVRKDISKYKVNADADLETPEKIQPNYVVSEEDIESSEVFNTSTGTLTTFNERDNTVIEALDLTGPVGELEIEELAPEQDDELEPPTPLIQLTEERLEEIIRAQSEEMLEKIIWKVVPDLASRIIERELDRLLSERDL